MVGRTKEVKTVQEFHEIISSSGDNLVVVDFYATWCGPCMYMAPIFIATSEKLEYKDVIFIKVNVDEDGGWIANEARVTNLPTFQFYKKGSKVHEFSGASEQLLISTLNTQASVGKSTSKTHSVTPHTVKTKGGKVTTVKTTLHSGGKISDSKSPKHTAKPSSTVKTSTGGQKTITYTFSNLGDLKDVLELLQTSDGDHSQIHDKLVKIQSKKPSESEESSHGIGKALHVTTREEFSEVLEQAGNNLVVVDFFATWCGPCMYMAPIFAETSEKYENVTFVKVDVDHDGGISGYQRVSGLPTFQFFKKGSKISEFSGASKELLISTIDSHC
jgi:thioredoxin 1